MTFRITVIKPAGITFGMAGTEANGWPCPYCARIMSYRGAGRSPTTDHVIPRSRGGPNTSANFLAVCVTCNGDKSNMTLFEFGGWLLGRGDARHEHVGRLAQYVADAGRFNRDETAAMYAEFGVGYQMAMRGKIHYGGPVPKRKAIPVAKPPEVRRDHVMAEFREMASTKMRIHNALSALGVPYTHWSFKPPRSVAVLIGSLMETFVFEDEAALIAAVSGHELFWQTRKTA